MQKSNKIHTRHTMSQILGQLIFFAFHPNLESGWYLLTSAYPPLSEQLGIQHMLYTEQLGIQHMLYTIQKHCIYLFTSKVMFTRTALSLLEPFIVGVVCDAGGKTE